MKIEKIDFFLNAILDFEGMLEEEFGKISNLADSW